MSEFGNDVVRYVCTECEARASKVSEPDDPRELGRIAFEAYGKSVGGRTYDGKPIPTWDEVTPAVREGWRDAAFAIRSAVGVGGHAVNLVAPTLPKGAFARLDDVCVKVRPEAEEALSRRLVEFVNDARSHSAEWIEVRMISLLGVDVSLAGVDS